LGPCFGIVFPEFGNTNSETNKIYKDWNLVKHAALKMPLVEQAESGDRFSFRLRRIGTPATYPGISDTFK